MTAQEVVEFLAGNRRTVLLGGMAVVLHGFNRSTKDLDIWIDPNPDADAWATPIRRLLLQERSLKLERIGNLPGVWEPIRIADLLVAANEDHLIRISGTDRPIDVFYLPNELVATDFEPVWQRAKPLEHCLRLMEEIDLIITKQLTNRAHDEADIRFLQDKIESDYRNRLPTSSAEEAKEMLIRFATPEIAAFAFKESRDPDVRLLGWNILNDMREAGDPFAADLIRELGSPDESHGNSP